MSFVFHHHQHREHRFLRVSLEILAIFFPKPKILIKKYQSINSTIPQHLSGHTKIVDPWRAHASDTAQTTIPVTLAIRVSPVGTALQPYQIINKNIYLLPT